MYVVFLQGFLPKRQTTTVIINPLSLLMPSVHAAWQACDQQ